MRVQSLVNDAIERIKRCDERLRFKWCVYEELSKFGLEMVAAQEGMFNRELWRKKNKEKIYKIVEMFLQRHVK